ncbi:hypothetical protein RCL1_003849 [Eukaryota sp. TZLM3-RCL]
MSPRVLLPLFLVFCTVQCSLRTSLPIPATVTEGVHSTSTVTTCTPFTLLTSPTGSFSSASSGSANCTWFMDMSSSTISLNVDTVLNPGDSVLIVWNSGGHQVVLRTLTGTTKVENFLSNYPLSLVFVSSSSGSSFSASYSIAARASMIRPLAAVYHSSNKSLLIQFNSKIVNEDLLVDCSSFVDVARPSDTCRLSGHLLSVYFSSPFKSNEISVLDNSVFLVQGSMLSVEHHHESSRMWIMWLLIGLVLLTAVLVSVIVFLKRRDQSAAITEQGYRYAV